MPELFDTHAHLHDDIFKLNPDDAIANAVTTGVSRIITVGTDANFSRAAIDLASMHENVWASVGLHPHEAKSFEAEIPQLEKMLGENKVVAIGECGLDYHYGHSSKENQSRALELQLAWAEKTKLPVILHVRSSKDGRQSAFDDLWDIWDGFYALEGVVHSFTAGIKELEQALERDLYVALNGIMTFSKDASHSEVIKQVPLEKLLLESDAPYLTPEPYRGKINQPKYVESTAKYLAEVKGVEYKQLAETTSANAEKLFLSN